MSKKNGTLYLVLKDPWFSMIEAGDKPEEYRENTAYYQRLFYKSMNAKDNEFQKYDRLVLAHGYTKDPKKRLVFRNPKFRVGEGQTKWGAEPGKVYFIITWDR